MSGGAKTAGQRAGGLEAADEALALRYQDHLRRQRALPVPACTRRAERRRGGASPRTRTQEEARSFIVSSLRRRLGLAICRELARHTHCIRRVPYIGVPRAVVERRMQRGQLIGGPQARDSAALRAVRRLLPVPGRRGAPPWPAARKRARTPRVPQGGRGARAPQTDLLTSRAALDRDRTGRHQLRRRIYSAVPWCRT